MYNCLYVLFYRGPLGRLANLAKSATLLKYRTNKKDRLTDVSCTLGSEYIDKMFNSICRMRTRIVIPHFQNSHFGTICES